jgi:predicted HAD superfamily Cof-like phosphohydrolase
MTLRNQLINFHLAVRQPILSRPDIPPEPRIRLRAALIAEEAFETLQAMLVFNEAEIVAKKTILRACKHAAVKVDMVELADGMADLDYVVEGTRLEFGIDGKPIADEVHRSNMMKASGPVAENGKRLKPVDWTPPNVKGELEKQGWKP